MEKDRAQRRKARKEERGARFKIQNEEQCDETNSEIGIGKEASRAKSAPTR